MQSEKTNDSPWYPNRFTIIGLDTASCGWKTKTLVFCAGTNDQYEAIETVAHSHTMGALMVRELLVIRTWQLIDVAG